MSRHRGAGASWFKNRAVSRRLNVEARHADIRDVGPQRIDLAALLAEPVEDYDEYHLDTVIAERDFRARARRWLTRAA